MKLITEEIEKVEVIVEHVNGKKNLYIEGVFLQGNFPNRNKRLYEMDTLREGVKTYTESYLSKDRAVGELGHPCLSGDARLLSVDSGWKHIQDCEENELVYTLNPVSKNVEIQPIHKVVINDHSGVMYTLKNRGIHTKITPDHRFLIINSRNHNDYQYVTAQQIFEDLNGDNKYSKWYIPKYSLGLKQEVPEYYTISKSNTSNKIEDDLKIDFKSFSAFLGIYLSEGCCTLHPNGTYNINISLNKKYRIQQINEVLHSMSDIEWTTKEESESKGEITWTTDDMRLGEYLIQFGNFHDRFVPKDFITLLNNEAANIFIDYYTARAQEFHIAKNSIDGLFSIIHSKQLADDISQIAITAGFSVERETEICKEDYLFANKIFCVKDESYLHYCSFLNTRGIYLDKRFMSMTTEEWNDKVYCIQVENTNFMVEQNGYTYWTGNCGPTINLDRVSHKIISLKESGSNFIGKAKILTTLPMGKIAAGLYEEGVKLGVSSRGLGSLIPTDKGYSVVGKDFMLSTAADIVHDPSAPEAFVNGIMEGKNWLYDSKKQEWIASNIKNKIESDAFSRRLTEERKVQHFENYLKLI